MSTLQEPTINPAGDGKVDPQTVTITGYVVDECYGPEHVQADDPDDAKRSHPRIGRPGEFPYTRGIHETMYRGRLWTMRQFAGFGSADDTNQRFKYLLENARGTLAKTGLSTAFDNPAPACLARWRDCFPPIQSIPARGTTPPLRWRKSASPISETDSCVSWPQLLTEPGGMYLQCKPGP